MSSMVSSDYILGQCFDAAEQSANLCVAHEAPCIAPSVYHTFGNIPISSQAISVCFGAEPLPGSLQEMGFAIVQWVLTLKKLTKLN